MLNVARCSLCLLGSVLLTFSHASTLKPPDHRWALNPRSGPHGRRSSVTLTSSPQVNVPGLGRLAGDVSTASPAIAFFKGIPYAHPPVKALRWQPPILRDEPLGTPQKPFDATKFGASRLSVVYQYCCLCRCLFRICVRAHSPTASVVPPWQCLPLSAKDAWMRVCCEC